MTTTGDICEILESIAPLCLSETWDNTGLIVGDRSSHASRVMTCLTITDETVAEAAREKVNLVVAHHPLPFKPILRLTTETIPGRLLWSLAKSGIAVFSPHTAWDSAERGINALIAESLELIDVTPLIPQAAPELAGLGTGRTGSLRSPMSLTQISARLAKRIPHCRPRGVLGERKIQRVAVSCGSGGGLLTAAAQCHCDLFVTGEATFHACLEAKALGMQLLMIGHYASERFAMEILAESLAAELPQLIVWSSRDESDPVQSL